MTGLQGFGSQIAAGALTTLNVALTSLALGTCLGLCGALAKRSHLKVLRILAHA